MHDDLQASLHLLSILSLQRPALLFRLGGFLRGLCYRQGHFQYLKYIVNRFCFTASSMGVGNSGSILYAYRCSHRLLYSVHIDLGSTRSTIDTLIGVICCPYSVRSVLLVVVRLSRFMAVRNSCVCISGKVFLFLR